MEKFKFIDLFCGIGGFHQAMSELGGKCVYASDIDPECRRIYKLNYGIEPDGDITKVKEEDIPAHDVLCAGFPCFVKGTKVLTKQGFYSIEELKIGDEVLTKEGTFKKVTSTMVSERNEIIRLKPQGFWDFIETTNEHPFWVIPKGEKTPRWKNAGEIQHLDKIGYRCIEGTSKSYTPEFWRMIGRFLGDGWVLDGRRKGRKNSFVWKVVICSAFDEKDECLKIIEDAGYHPTISKERTTYKFIICNKELCEFCSNFGRYAANKKLSPECFSLDYERKLALWEGYVSADGHKGKNHIYVSSVSEDLILGFAQIARDVFKTTNSISKVIPSRKECIIEGRKVNEHPWYRLSVCCNKNERYGFYQDGFVWMNIKKLEKVERNETVYNISVDESETYNVYGITVHNCQSFSKAGKRLGFGDPTRGTLFFDILRILKYHQPKYALLENVRNLAGHDNGNTWKVIHDALEDAGYNVPETPKIFSPHYLGIPQHRERVFIMCVRKDVGDVPQFTFDKKNIPECNIDSILLEDSEIPNIEKYQLDEKTIDWINLWNEFIQGIKSDKLPTFPVWSEHLCHLADEKDPAIRYYYSGMPDWKEFFIRKNHELFISNEEFISKWIEKAKKNKMFFGAKAKLEWQAGQTTHPDLWENIMQVRPSGLRVKPGTYFPALVAITQTPIVGKRKRRLTPRECARLQSFPDTFIIDEQDRYAYKQFGNSVNVAVVKLFAKLLLGK